LSCFHCCLFNSLELSCISSGQSGRIYIQNVPCSIPNLITVVKIKDNVKSVSILANNRLVTKANLTPETFKKFDISQTTENVRYIVSIYLFYLQTVTVTWWRKYPLMRASVFVPVGIHQRLLLRGGSDLSAGGNCLMVMNCMMWRTIIRSFSTSNLRVKINGVILTVQKLVNTVVVSERPHTQYHST
jgi:hypothetical protein